MKAVALETKDGYTAVLQEDGTVEKIRGIYEPGETLTVDASMRAETAGDGSGKTVRFRRTRGMIAAAAAALVLVAGGAGTYTMTAQAYSYVSIDVNPSIEYTLNRLDRIIGAEALNGEAQTVVSALEEYGIRGKTLAEALTVTGQILRENGYLTDEEEYLLVNIAPGSERHAPGLQKAAEDVFGDAERTGDVLSLNTSTPATRRTAKKLGISSGRYEEIRAIKAEESGGNPEEITPGAEEIETYRNVPVRELLQDAGKIDAGAPAPGGTQPSPPQNDMPQGQEGAPAPGGTQPSLPQNDMPQGQEGAPAPDGTQPSPPQNDMPQGQEGAPAPDGMQPAQPPQGGIMPGSGNPGGGPPF